MLQKCPDISPAVTFGEASKPCDLETPCPKPTLSSNFLLVSIINSDNSSALSDILDLIEL